MNVHPSWRGGQLSRSEYWLNAFLALIVIGILGAVLILMSKTGREVVQEGQVVWNVSWGVITVALLYFTVLWNICRVRDFGYGWGVGLLFTLAGGIPIVGLAFLLLLGCYPSKKLADE